MLTAGDEFGRTQHGNNNAYAQDNEMSWLDWSGRDRDLEDFAFALSAIRKQLPVLRNCAFLTGEVAASGFRDVEWLTETANPMAEKDWNDPGRRRLTMVLAAPDQSRVAIVINGDRRASAISLPRRAGLRWRNLTPGDSQAGVGRPDGCRAGPAFALWRKLNE